MSKEFISRLPAKFVQNTSNLCGEKGKRWLSDLPKTIGEIESEWSIRAGNYFPNLSYNYVASAVCSDGSPAILKIGLPLDNVEIFTEAHYLRTLDGNGAVRLLNVDDSRHAILLERAVPGLNLKVTFDGRDSEAVSAAVWSFKRVLHSPPENDTDYLSLENWFGALKRVEEAEFPQSYAVKALEHFEKMSTDHAREFLLHGDLHHENILSATREPFLVINPKGIVGHIGYEVAVFLNNHHWWLAEDPDLDEKLSFAVREFSLAFDIDPFDLRRWAFAQMVLSAWWTYEENGPSWKSELALADIWKV